MFQLNEIKSPWTALGFFFMVNLLIFVFLQLLQFNEKMTFRMPNWPPLLIRFHGSVLKGINH